MKTTTIALVSLSLVLAGVGILPGAAAEPNYCSIPFVGGFVDQTCDQGVGTTYNTTCWFIGWFCESAG